MTALVGGDKVQAPCEPSRPRSNRRFPGGIQAAHAAGARSVGYAAVAASAGHLPVAGADAVIFPMAGPGIPAASARRRSADPEVETFRSARRTGAICGSRLTAQGDQEFHGRQAATAPSRLAALRGAA